MCERYAHIFEHELGFGSFSTTHWMLSVLCFSRILPLPHSMGILPIASFWSEFYLGEPHPLHHAVSKPKSTVPYTTRTKLEEIRRCSLYTFSKHTRKSSHCLHSLWFSPRVRTKPIALLSHNQMQTLLKRRANFTWPEKGFHNYITSNSYHRLPVHIHYGNRLPVHWRNN